VVSATSLICYVRYLQDGAQTHNDPRTCSRSFARVASTRSFEISLWVEEQGHGGYVETSALAGFVDCSCECQGRIAYSQPYCQCEREGSSYDDEDVRREVGCVFERRVEGVYRDQ
jgi:hypothetical protein